MSTIHRQAAQAIRQQQNELAGVIVDRQYGAQPETWNKFSNQPGREKSIRDAGYHLSYLAEALQADDPILFTEYLAWVKVLFNGLKFSDQVLPTTLEQIRQALTEKLPAGLRTLTLSFLETGVHSLEQAPLSLPGYLQGDSRLDEIARQFLDELLRGNRQVASHLILDAARNGTNIQDLYLQVFQRSQYEIGRLWQTNQISVAQEHFCTAATQMIMSQLYPYIFTGEHKDRRLVLACVGSELHEIGARMVADFFEMNGWDTYFLGANTPPESILATVDERKAHVLALSATMTFHISKVADIIRDLRLDTACQTRVLVGGYPFNLSPGLWHKVGADGFAFDAQTAIAEADRILAG
jgi:methanogenic corrinoid protein MtbC1